MVKREIVRKIRKILKTGKSSELKSFLESLNHSDTARCVTDLSEKDREKLFSMLLPVDAASVLRDLPDSQAADVIEEMNPGKAADIVEEMPSADRVDVLHDMSENAADAILDQMEPEEAADARNLLKYPENSAGGIMLTEFFSYATDKTVQYVLDDLKNNRDKYKQFIVQYIYVTSPAGKLEGVLKVRDLVMEHSNAGLKDIMLKNPISVNVNDGVEKLISVFSEHNFIGLPVVDSEKKLLGIILRYRLQEAVGELTSESFLKASGIVGGEEFRSMRLSRRVFRRLSWLSINVFLNVIAASVIALHQDTISAAVVLAVFLPIISDMSGCSGKQAVAVSIRELTIGLISPADMFMVFLKEFAVAAINGIVLGLLLASVAIMWKGNMYLGLIVGAALALNTMLAAVLGGLLPLMLRKMKMDPALASGPILTTITDMCGFFFVLTFASWAINYIK